MSWVKRNLYFLVSSVVAVALLGLAGYYFYSNYNLNNDNHKKLDDAYAELTRLSRATITARRRRPPTYARRVRRTK